MSPSNLPHTWLTILFVVVLFLSGCSGYGHIYGNVLLTNDEHPSGWKLEIRQTAVDSYLYAQLALNAYQRADSLILPSEVIQDSVVSRKHGLDAVVYSIQKCDGNRRELVIAYRGTAGVVDWVKGNFLALQNNVGLGLFDEVRAVVGEDVPITLTGHSLGGAIALHVSLRRDDAPAYVFNSSSRFTAGNGEENLRVSVSQHREILRPLRMMVRSPTGRHSTINCAGWYIPMGSHGMRPLAVCLTQIAATEDDRALASLRTNGLTKRYPRRESNSTSAAPLREEVCEE